ncbi:MAG: LamG domain-containing protein, partial [Planctomycetes bacterium]|nr:LamG domain-containing protein [Planctomycetota bacterium]
MIHATSFIAALLCVGWLLTSAPEAANDHVWGPVGQLNGAEWDKDGFAGTCALRFDGHGHRFVIASDEMLLDLAQFTVEVRIKTAALLHNLNIVIGQYKDPGSAQNAWVMLLDKAGKPRFTIFSADGAAHTVSADIALADGQWHLLHACYDGQEMGLAVDGKAAGGGIPHMRMCGIRHLAAKPVSAGIRATRLAVHVGGGAVYAKDDVGKWGGFCGLADDVRLYGRAGDVAAHFDFNEGHGKTIRSLGGAAAARVLCDRRVALVKDGQPNMTIVYGQPHQNAARKLRDELAGILGVALPMAEDAQVLAAKSWRLADEWARRNLLLVGNIHTNRALLPLYAQVLTAASAGYPGPGRYELRVLFSPLRRGADMIVIGASDAAGVDAGANRLVQLARRLTDKGAPPFVELGSADGPDAPRSEAFQHFYDAAARCLWHGSLAAGARARDLLLADMAKRERGLWGFDKDGHYQWEGHYRALRGLLAAGVFSGEERRRIDERLLQNALLNEDWAGVAAVSKDAEGVNRSLNRHVLSAVIGQFVLFEHLDHVGQVASDKQAAVRKTHELLRGHVESFVRHGRFRANMEGREGLDCVNALAGLYLHFGDERAVQDGIFCNMADYYVANVDNLGYQAGQDSYITCRPGSHYAGTYGGLGLLAAGYFHRDGQYRWIAEKMPWFSSASCFLVRVPPSHFSLPEEVSPTYPARHTGLAIVPMDPYAHSVLKARNADEAALPLDAPYERAFSKAVFRDGFAADDAYLMLQGINIGAQNPNDGYQGNAIVRYTELGSLLLFHNTQRQTSWARNVVSTSRGEHDAQGAGCVLQAKFRSPVVSGVQSLLPQDGGAAWRRSIIRRHGGYFVALDEMTAHADDSYQFTCRWRSFHHGETDGRRAFRATDGMNGTTLHIVASEPVAQAVRLEPRDGAAEPTVLRQLQSARLSQGQAAAFQNLIYATNEAARRAFDIRKLTARAALVKGESKDFAELAAVGTDDFRPLTTVTGACKLWYLSSHGFMTAGARSVALPGRFRIHAQGEFNLLLLPGDAAGVIENPSETPLELSLECEPGHPVRLMAELFNSANRVYIGPGRHPVRMSAASAFFREAEAELRKGWEKLAFVPAATKASEGARGSPWQEVWRYDGIRPPLRKHLTIKASAEPATTVGAPAAWVDRRIHYSAPSAGWAAGVEGAAFLDLYQDVSIASIRVVGAMGAFKQGEMAFEVVLSSDGFNKDVRKLSIPDPRFETHYAEMAHYMYTYQHPVYVLPVGQRARHVKLVGRWRERKDAVLFHEIEVVTTEPQPMAKTILFVEDFLGSGQK